MTDIRIKLVGDGKMPVFKHDGDACADCHARLAGKSIAIPAHTRCLVNLGFALGLPDGYEAVIRPRSGLSKGGIDIAIGTIDSGFRGEVRACVINNTDDPFPISDGERICQIAVRKAERVNFIVADELSDTDRGDGGFGSTGIK